MRMYIFARGVLRDYVPLEAIGLNPNKTGGGVNLTPTPVGFLRKLFFSCTHDFETL